MKQILVNHGGKDPENPQPIAVVPLSSNPPLEASPTPEAEVEAPAPTIIQREAPLVIRPRVIYSNESDEEQEEQEKSEEEKESDGEMSI
ncbi:hypothetical protein TrLO_g9593 [Triparma laevis f. longispina]|uniref:Uncharacterized protein n=1 Tax=Triparma laevis f. longispina TaxID=1714387 RepID=A0A9W7F1L7_9STRA|nr:hypothetical protein TrLO_g9593 [Triparma laevis f. longispina]